MRDPIGAVIAEWQVATHSGEPTACYTKSSSVGGVTDFEALLVNLARLFIAGSDRLGFGRAFLAQKDTQENVGCNA